MNGSFLSDDGIPSQSCGCVGSEEYPPSFEGICFSQPLRGDACTARPILPVSSLIVNLSSIGKAYIQLSSIVSTCTVP